MNTLSIPVVAMASISFYVGLYHLLIYLRRRQNRENLTFALLCFAIVAYDAFCTGLYNATSVAEGVQWQRGQFISLALFIPAFLWFVSDYTRQKPGIAVYLFSAFYLGAIIVQLVDRSGLTFPLDQLSVKRVTLPHIQPIIYYEAALGPFTTVQGLIGMVASTYILILGIRYFRGGYKREAIPLILAILFMYAAGLHDTLVSNGVYHFVYLIEYAYLAVILLMAYSLSNTIVEAAIAKEELHKSEERFRSLVETTSDWVWEIDANGRYTYASPQIHDLLGYKPEEIVGRSPLHLMSAEEAKRVDAILQDHMSQQKPLISVENIVLSKDGQQIVLDTSGVPFFDEHGNLAGYRGIDRDVTERKRVEEALQEKTEELDRYFTSSLDLLCIADTDGHFRRLNPEWEKTLGFSISELEGRQFIEFVHPEDVEATLATTASLAAQEQITNFQNRYRCKDGSYRWIEWRSYPVGKMVYAVARDITERKQVEEALRESEQKFRLFVEQSSDGLIFTDEQGNIIGWNEAQERLTGFSRQEIIGKPLWDVQPLFVSVQKPGLSERLKQKILLALQSGQADFLDKPMEIVLCHRNGTRVIAQQMAFSIRTNQGYRLGSIIRDVTELKEAGEELRASEERYRTLVEVSPIGIWISKDQVVTYANPAALKIFGATDPNEIVGKTSFDFIHPDYHAVVRERIAQMMETRKLAPLQEEKYMRLDGSAVDVEVIATPLITSEGTIIQVFFQDIAERKQAEQDLRESEERLRQITSALRETIWLRDAKTRQVLYVNPAFEQLTGWTCESFYEDPDIVIDAIHPNDKEWVLEALAQRFEGVPYHKEHRITHRNGSVRWVSGRSFPVQNEAGEVFRWVSIMEDITERKQAEEELRASEERYRTLVEVSPTAMWISKNQVIAYVNPAAVRALGARDASEIVGRISFDFIHPDYHKIVIGRISQIVGEGKTVPLLEEKYVRLDGSVIDVEVIATPFITPEDTIVQVFFQDITERKRAAEALREKNHFIASLLRAIPVAVFYKDKEGRYQGCNDEFAKFMNVSAEEIIGKTVYELWPSELADKYHQMDLELMQQQQHQVYDYQVKAGDGQLHPVIFAKDIYLDRNGEVAGLVGAFLDITNLKQAEAEREALIAHLEAQNAELERFTYTVSHDLKAPLITIRGFLGFVEQDAQSGNLNRLKEDIQRISAATEKMQRLLDELLELSRIGRLMNPPANIFLGDLVQEALKLMEGRLQERNVEVKIQDDLPVVFGDSQRLSEVVQNLLDNAVKFMGKQLQPIIEIGVRGEENGMPVIYVRDNGIGIAPEHHERIFGLFNKLNPSAEGTGVGLAIVKRIIEVQGGRIWVESEEGKGATFYFTVGKGMITSA